MTKVADPTLYWAVIARPRGEVLTAEADSPGLHLGLLGVPPGFGTNAAEGWLYDVIGVAHESSPTPPGTQPIPPLLHHALTGLLFSHEELWSSVGGPRPCSFAFAHTVHEVGFGWVGDAHVTVFVDGEATAPGWVRVIDEAGREAHAWSISSDHSVQVMMAWNASPDQPNAGADVEAVWTAVTNLEPAPVVSSSTIEAQAPAMLEPTAANDGYSARLEALQAQLAIESEDEVESVEVVTEYPDAVEPTAVRMSSGGSAIARWLRRGLSWFTGRKEVVTDDAALERPADAYASEAGQSDDGDEVVEEAVATVSESVSPAQVSAPVPLPSPAPSPTPAVLPIRVVAPEPAPIVAKQQVEPIEPPAIVAEQQVEPVGPPAIVAKQQVEPVEPPAIVAPVRVTPVMRPPVVVTTSIAPVAVPDLIPPTPEPPAVTRTAAAAPPPPVAFPTSSTNIWRRVPENIPPTPEPAELTVRAAAWSAPPDPHIIELPAPKPTPAKAPLKAPAKGPVASKPAVAPTLRERTVIRPALQRPETEAPELVIESSVPVIAAPESAPVAKPARARAFSVAQQPPTWPSAQQLSAPSMPLWRRPWIWALAAVVLVLGGWLVGAIQDADRSRDASGRGALAKALHAIGLGGPRFDVSVTSRPAGAWISVDGKTLELRTPSVVEVTPGEHTIALSFPELGGASYTVRGLKGDRVPLDATLWGALEIFSPNKAGVLSVEVDGVSRGFAPLRVDSLTPGVHEVHFSGLGMTPWGETVDVRVGETKEVLARATNSPATGVLQVNASLTDEQGTQPLKGGQVWIDGESRGVLPLTLDLPRGPHSVRLVYKGLQAPIQVIDLPGGNQRFAVFEFGLDAEPAQLITDLPPRIARDRPTVVSASLTGSGAGEVREMWLHVQTPEGPWKRYPMTLLKSAGNIVGVLAFPINAFDGQDRARYYLSAQNMQGDESFTEIRTIQIDKPATR